MVADLSPLGRIGVLLIGTRGPDGPGEVKVKIRGGSETYLAYSDEPLARGTTVLVVETRGARTVSVTSWSDPFTVS
jgi:membrane protein implicated in regulation of membrane protease activity